MVQTADERPIVAFACPLQARLAGSLCSGPSVTVSRPPHPVVAETFSIWLRAAVSHPLAVVRLGDRRVFGEMGSTSGSFPDCGSLARSLVGPAHQRFRVGSGVPRTPTLSTSSSGLLRLSPLGQLYDGGLCQPSGRDALAEPVARSEDTVHLVPTARGDPTSPPPSQEGEHVSRPSVTAPGSTDRMVTVTSGDTFDLANLRTSSSRSVCVRDKRAVPSVLRTVARRQSVEDRCVLLPMGASPDLRLSSVRPHSSRPRQGEGRRGEPLAGGPQWPGQPWFPSLLELLFASPRALPPRVDLLRMSKSREVHPRVQSLYLTVWPSSGNPSSRRAFRRRLPRWRHGVDDHRPSVCMLLDSSCFENGVQTSRFLRIRRL